MQDDLGSMRRMPGGGRVSLRRTSLAALGALLISGGCQRAQAQSGPASPRAFATAYMTAIRAQDLAKLKSLSHPATLACINKANRSYFDRAFDGELKLGATLRPGFTISSVKPVSGAPMLGLLPPEGFAYPVRPTILIQIEAEDQAHNSATLFHYLAQAHGGWFTVDPCPNAKGMQFLTTHQRQGAR